MKRVFYLFFFFCFFSTPFFTYGIHLKEKLSEAEIGSYLVTEQNKTYTFLYIHDKTERTIFIEEVTIPGARFKGRSINWREWFEKGAPGHSSWLISQINLQTGFFEETFSFTQGGWIDLSHSNPFFTTLLNLSFHPVPDMYRRRVGSTAGVGQGDRRPFWNPRLIVDGRPLSSIPFTVWQARWPSDGSELAKKVIKIYLPQKESGVSYPTYFPYWCEVEGKMGSAKVHVVDSGMNVRSPKAQFAPRPIQLQAVRPQQGKGLVFHLQNPSCYKEFSVIVEQVDAFFAPTLPLPVEISFLDNHITELTIAREELAKLQWEGERCRFTLIPEEAPAQSIQTIVDLKGIVNNFASE